MSSSRNNVGSSFATRVPPPPSQMRFLYVGTHSTMRQAEVDDLVSKYSIPYQYKCRAARGDEAPCTPNLNEICIYQEMLVSRFHLPLPNEILHILKYYKIAPGQVHPNSWCHLISFFLFFLHLNRIPSVDLFRHVYSLNVEKKPDERTSGKISTGWYYFNSRKNTKRPVLY
ncbi:hypothetical protein NE237_015225 [Protea cynaroides]|uniref:Transposase (putative) gypsy type domain-containing protein n=1 Tax=Protea cynaroides TaxID=273540 RepID=A0A9Q0KDN1_9MAGN|nr:hypothetical protein NE237_015225 [Protea cynaroides]